MLPAAITRQRTVLFSLGHVVTFVHWYGGGSRRGWPAADAGDSGFLRGPYSARLADVHGWATYSLGCGARSLVNSAVGAGQPGSGPLADGARAARLRASAGPVAASWGRNGSGPTALRPAWCWRESGTARAPSAGDRGAVWRQPLPGCKMRAVPGDSGFSLGSGPPRFGAFSPHPGGVGGWLWPGPRDSGSTAKLPGLREVRGGQFARLLLAPRSTCARRDQRAGGILLDP